MTINNDPMRDAIVDTAVELAARTSWEAVRLYDIAAGSAISLDEIRLYFREKDELIDAWFDRADSRMLKEAESTGFLDLTASERIHHLIMTWLDALAVQRKVTRQMITSKLEFGHIHIQIPAVMRVSRTVQWVREAAQRDGHIHATGIGGKHADDHLSDDFLFLDAGCIRKLASYPPVSQEPFDHGCLAGSEDIWQRSRKRCSTTQATNSAAVRLNPETAAPDTLECASGTGAKNGPCDTYAERHAADESGYFFAYSACSAIAAAGTHHCRKCDSRFSG